MRRLPFLIFLLLAAAFTAAAQTRPQNTPELRKKTFEKAWKTVDKNFYDPKFNGVDWKAVKKQYEPLVAAAKSDAEFYDLMKRMLRELKVSHMDLIVPSEANRMRTAPSFTGLGIREIGGNLVITSVLANSSAAEAGLKPGFVISRINGDPVATFADVQSRLPGPPYSKMKLGYLDANDEAREVDLERRPISEDNKSRLGSLTLYGIFESKRLDGNLGYIYFSNFIPFIGDRIKTAVESMLGTDGIIIDLRGNSGGDDLVGLKMAGLFFEKSTQLMFSRTRHGDDEFEYFAHAGKTPYKGKIAILVDEFSKSASEQFAAGMQESGRAVIVGNKTPGEDLDGDLAEMPDGSLLLYAVGQPRTPKGRIIEGNGVIPNIEVSRTRSELLVGRDAQLEAAIAYIRSNRK